jgi:hypothetical protein
MTAIWDDVKAALMALEGSGALIRYPDPRWEQPEQPPFVIQLAPWATEAAEELHRRFGASVTLLLGSFPYPESQPRIWPGGDGTEEMDPAEMTVRLDAPIVVSSGHNVRGALRVNNLSADAIVAMTNGIVTAQVVNPLTGEVVGGYTGFQTAPLVRFEVAPGETTVIPLLVGTASANPALGHAVPGGEWAVRADLRLEDGRRLRTPPLPITVTD